jgi:hypothetical protein
MVPRAKRGNRFPVDWNRKFHQSLASTISSKSISQPGPPEEQKEKKQIIQNLARFDWQPLVKVKYYPLTADALARAAEGSGT